MSTNPARVPIILLVYLIGVAPASAQTQGPTEQTKTFGEAFSEAQAAYAIGDWEALRDALTLAETLSPNHPLVLYHLARAEGLLDNHHGALEILGRLAEAGGTQRDLSADTAFTALRGTAEFVAAIESLRAAAEPVVRSDTALVLPDPDFIPEGIAHNPDDGSLFIGSLHRGQIIRAAPDGDIRVFVEDAAGASDSRRGQVIGLRVDPPRNFLWAATLVIDSTAPRFARGPGGWASLRAFDLTTGRLMASYAAPDSSSAHLLNDIAIAANGDVFVTDSEGDAVFRLPSDGTQLVAVLGRPSGLDYPNGIAVDVERTQMYVAHTAGVSAIRNDSVASEGASTLLWTNGSPLGGFDGLYKCGAGLLAIQALLDSYQVAYLALDRGGSGVTRSEVLERRHPAHDAPTTGAIVGDYFYYIASSQLGRLLPDGEVRDRTSEIARSIVLRLPLHGICGYLDSASPSR